MIATKRFLGVAMVLALVPAMTAAQQHDMSKMGKDTAKKAPMAGMKHDMSGMKMDTGKMAGMKHDMPKMGQGGMMDMKSGWAELDAFHTLLMATWHPAQKDSLGPARTMAPTLVTSAEAWAKSKGPAKCDNAAARKVLPGVVADVNAFAAVVARKGTDAEVKAALKKAHEGFVKVAMPCMMGDMKGMGGMKHEQMKSGWKEFDAFHALLMPVAMAAKTDDLKPARAQATAIVKGAEAMAASKGPAKCDNAAARKLMPGVVGGAKAYGDAVAKKAADADVKAALQTMHDAFQKMARPCMMGDMPGMKH
jgi:hypothetical protein